MQKNLIIAVVITAIVAGGAGFAYGKKAGATSAATTLSQGQSGRGNFAGGTGRGGRTGGGAVGGQIIAKDANSITVELRGNQTDGSAGSKIIFLSDTTQVMKSAQGTTSDLTIGTQVMAIGTPNADGSVNAQSVQIRPTTPDFGRPSTTPKTN